MNSKTITHTYQQGPTDGHTRSMLEQRPPVSIGGTGVTRPQLSLTLLFARATFL